MWGKGDKEYCNITNLLLLVKSFKAFNRLNKQVFWQIRIIILLEYFFNMTSHMKEEEVYKNVVMRLVGRGGD